MACSYPALLPCAVWETAISDVLKAHLGNQKKGGTGEEVSAGPWCWSREPFMGSSPSSNGEVIRSGGRMGEGREGKNWTGESSSGQGGGRGGSRGCHCILSPLPAWKSSTRLHDSAPAIELVQIQVVPLRLPGSNTMKGTIIPVPQWDLRMPLAVSPPLYCVIGTVRTGLSTKMKVKEGYHFRMPCLTCNQSDWEKCT